jgi:hypothetical protein
MKRIPNPARNHDNAIAALIVAAAFWFIAILLY